MLENKLNSSEILYFASEVATLIGQVHWHMSQASPSSRHWLTHCTDRTQVIEKRNTLPAFILNRMARDILLRAVIMFLNNSFVRDRTRTRGLMANERTRYGTIPSKLLLHYIYYTY